MLNIQFAGLNSIGDYDYYVYEEEYKNPLNLQVEALTEQPETSEDTLAADMVSDSERKKMEKIQYKKSLFSQLSKKEIKHLYENDLGIISFLPFCYEKLQSRPNHWQTQPLFQLRYRAQETFHANCW